MLKKLFYLTENKTNIRTELIAGLTTFLAMSYIIFINPEIMSLTGMNKDSVFVATCLAASIGSLIMAFTANWPIGMAPGMGLNAFFSFTVVESMGFSWEQALGVVFISGIIFLVLTISGIRSWLIQGIPKTLQSSTVSGIGLFLAIIALSQADIVVSNPITKVTIGNLNAYNPLLSIFGFLLIAALDAAKIRGSIIIGILSVTLLSIFIGHSEFKGIFAVPPSLFPTFMKLNITSALSIGLLDIILIFILVEIFDATGTLIAISKRAKLLNKSKNRLGYALFADSITIVIGSMLGTSSTTAFIESATGVQAGGRTGLTALTISLLFLAALFVSPLAASVPICAISPALLYVACLMMRELVEINWEDITESAPASLSVFMIPFTYSIANGLAFGFITYTILKSLNGKYYEIHPATWLVSILFALRYYFLNI
ncbi:MAG: NCS2 family permease [Bordetella sp.]|nr:MAG: NCS2 family permease [Bordetella sp.]